MRKKLVLGLFVALVVLYVGCGYKTNTAYTVEGVVKFISSETLQGIEGKLLTWEEGQYVTSASWESSHRARVWFVYPSDELPSNIKGRKIRVIYYIVRWKDIPILYVKDCEVSK